MTERWVLNASPLIVLGKCLELYSKHYPNVLQGGEPVPVSEAINRLWDIIDSLAAEAVMTRLPASLSSNEQVQVSRFIRNTLQDVTNLMANCRQTVQFVVRGKIDRGQYFEVRQPSGEYVNLSAVFGNRLHQEANDWLVAPLWI